MNQTIIELLTVSCPLGLAKWKISFLVTGFVIIVLIYLFSRLRLLSNEAKKHGLKGLLSGGGRTRAGSGSAKDPINKSISTGVYDLPEIVDGSSLDDVINKTKSKRAKQEPVDMPPKRKPIQKSTTRSAPSTIKSPAKTDQPDDDFWKSVIDNPDIPEYE